MRRRAVCCVLRAVNKTMLSNGTLLWSGKPWCFWGKPTGDGPRVVTLEPNVEPPGTKHLEGMEPDQPEDPFSTLGQMLTRMEEMRRAQAEENRQFLEALQDPPALRPTPVPQDSAELPTPVPQDPSELPSPRTRRSCRLPFPRIGEAAVPQDPSELPTPVPQDPSAEGRTWFPVTRCRPLIPGSRRRRPLPLPRLHSGQSQLPVPHPGGLQLPVPVDPRAPSS